MRCVDALDAANATSPTSSHSTLFDLLDGVNRCDSTLARSQCRAFGGECKTEADGYYPVCFITAAMGLVLLLLFIKPRVERLESLDIRHWRLKSPLILRE